MWFVVSVLLLFIAVESSQPQNPLIVLLRHVKPGHANYGKSRKSPLDKAAIEAYYRSETGLLRSCLRNCDDTTTRSGFECVQKCKVQCRDITDILDNSDKTKTGHHKKKTNKTNIVHGNKKNEFHIKKNFREEKCEKDDYLCIYLSMVESNEDKNVKGDILTLIAGSKESARSKGVLFNNKYRF